MSQAAGYRTSERLRRTRMCLQAARRGLRGDCVTPIWKSWWSSCAGGGFANVHAACVQLLQMGQAQRFEAHEQRATSKKCCRGGSVLQGPQHALWVVECGEFERREAEERESEGRAPGTVLAAYRQTSYPKANTD